MIMEMKLYHDSRGHRLDSRHNQQMIMEAGSTISDYIKLMIILKLKCQSAPPADPSVWHIDSSMMPPVGHPPDVSEWISAIYTLSCQVINADEVGCSNLVELSRLLLTSDDESSKPISPQCMAFTSNVLEINPSEIQPSPLLVPSSASWA